MEGTDHWREQGRGLRAFRSASLPEGYLNFGNHLGAGTALFSTTSTSSRGPVRSFFVVHPAPKIRVSSLSASVWFVLIGVHRDDTARLNEMGAG
jgi:hypothetical protein